MDITKEQRKKLEYYLHRFYTYYPEEKYTIFHFVKYFKRRIATKKDAWMGVSGDTGVGKSLFVLTSMILYGKKLSLINNIAYIPQGDEIQKKFSKLRRSVLLIDEAAKEMRSVNWQSKAQQKVNEDAMTERYLSNWVFLNIPSFQEFTKSMRRGNLQFRAIIPFRTEHYARVFIQRKSRNWRAEDPWGDKEASDIYQRMEKRRIEITNDKITSIERGLPNHVMDFIIPNLEVILPDVTSEYERLKKASRDPDREDIVDTSDAKSARIKKMQTEHDEIMSRVAKILWFNELDLGKTRVKQKEILNALGVSHGKWKKWLKMPKN